MKNDKHILKLCMIALMAALAYISFTFFKINIPTPGGYTAFHLGNTFVILASLLLGGLAGGIAGAIGMGIGDLLDPLYILVAPKTILLKLGIGLITGTVAHRVLKIRTRSGSSLRHAVFLSAGAGMLFNCLGEPLFSYFYTAYILGAPEKAAKSLAAWNALTTCTNAVLTILIASALYLAVYPRLQKSDFLRKIAPHD